MDNDINLLRIFKYIISSIFCIFLLVIFIWALCLFGKEYNVWASKKDGQAELAHAEYNRHIKVYEAQALEESARFLAKAEIERAKGVAEANKIIGQSLNDNEAYLRYLWIQGLQTNEMSVVYIPTEANLPIMEANRLKK